MNRIYLDQAATSFPKGEGVAEAMTGYMTNLGTNINRGSYEDAYETAGMVYETREMLCRLFDFGLCRSGQKMWFLRRILRPL